MSLQLKATGYDGDPGPKMFPLIGAVILAICGIAIFLACVGEDPINASGRFIFGGKLRHNV